MDTAAAAASGNVDSLFKGVVAVFVEQGVQPRRLQIWKQKLEQRGGSLRQHIKGSVTHIFATDVRFLQERVGRGHSLRKLRKVALKYDWLEDCLTAGHSVACEPYLLIDETRALSPQKAGSQESLTFSENSLEGPFPRSADSLEQGLKTNSRKRDKEENSLSDDDSHKHRRIEDWMSIIETGGQLGVVGPRGITFSQSDADNSLSEDLNRSVPYESVGGSPDLATGGESQQVMNEIAMTYDPPNLNKTITDIFGELKAIYGDALGDVRRSFSYYKANSVLEKLPFKITSVDQVKGLPTIGKSLCEHIGEILETGTLAKLDHFKADEKVSAISQFAAVWGIGPVTARKLYEMGHRTLDDLKGENSLSTPQRIGLQFHDDINKKIPRHEIQEMEKLIHGVATSIDQNVMILCGGSYRRGKAFSGDMDMVVTHPDGHSHAGFLRKLVHKLKELDFLTEDLQVGMDHEEADRGVDTYFGLCKYPGREQQHRIDFKVFPYEKYPYGLIAWTGNDVLNRRLRILADSKGYKLDDHGCFPFMTNESGEKIADRRTGVPCKSEREVFKFLGFPWLEPHQRNL